MNEVLDRLEQQLIPALDRHVTARKRRRRLRLSIIGVGVAVASVWLVSLALPRAAVHGRQLIAQARAALQGDDAVVEIEFTQPTSNGYSTGTLTQQQWYATNPTRWRAVINAPTLTPRPGTRTDRGLHGRVELSYAAGTYRFYRADRNQLTIITGLKATSATATGPPTLLGGDAASALRTLLASRTARDHGAVRVDGRSARRITATVKLRSGAVRLSYDVDPTTFAPIAAQLVITDGHGHRLPTATYTILRFQRLPEDGTALRMAPHPGAHIVHLTATNADNQPPELGLDALLNHR